MAYFKYKSSNVHFEEIGKGNPLFLLHGNTASSKMFDYVVDLYKDDFKIILIDFLGHGNSDRLNQFPIDFWYDQAMQAISLITLNDYGKVNLIGTSGGALAALNVALERSDLVNKVIADSFEGEKAVGSIARYIPEERKQSKSTENARMFWEYCHGEDWESVVDNDTTVVIKHEKSIKKFFHKDLSNLCVPVMLTASLEDNFAQVAGLDFGQLYKAMSDKIADGKLHLFPSGGHPAMLTNAEEFSVVAKKFFIDCK